MKYSEEIVKEICKSIELGHTQKDAAGLAGISEDTFYAWKKEKPEFSESLRRAHERYKDKLLKLLHGAATAKQDARTALEILARRYPGEWGEKLKLEVSINPQEEMKKIDDKLKEQWPEKKDTTNGLLPPTSETTPDNPTG